jgi:hypothetical protein
MENQSETNTTAAAQLDAAPDADHPAEVKATPETLTSIIKLLEPLSSAQRQRTVAAVMMFLGEAPLQKPPRQQEASGGGAGNGKGNDDGEAEGDYSAQITKWMKQNNVSAEELDRVFHFNADGSTFNLLHAPGKSKKEQVVNTYTLTGLGKFLAANDRSFDDATARNFCETIGCLDTTNHATYLKKNKGGEFTGDKTKGYSLTNVGIKRGAVLVKEKEVAGG